jgi:hypothetical protein
VLVSAAVALGGTRAGALEVDSRFGRWTLGGYAEGYAVFEVDRDSQRQRPTGLLDLTLTGDVHPKARVLLETRGTWGGPPEHADGIGVFDLSNTFQNLSPGIEFEEGYVDLFLPAVDLRLGKQKFAWGRLDRFQPTDILNPRRFTDPFVMDVEDQKLGIPSAFASIDLPSLVPQIPSYTRLGLVWIPVPFPTRFALEEERWFPSSTVPPGGLVIFKGALDPDAGIPPDRAIVRTSFRTENARPPQQLDEGAVGARLTGLTRGVDWSLYYYDGAETRPAFEFATRLAAPSGNILRLQGNAVLRPLFDRIRLWGGDTAFQMAGFTARVEGAYGMDRLQPSEVSELISIENVRRALPAPDRLGRAIAKLATGGKVTVDLGDLFVARDTVEWGAGIDYLYKGWLPLLQVNQTLVLNNPTQLLVNDVDTTLMLVVRKGFLSDRLQTEIVALQGLERGYNAGIARFTYSITDNLRIRLGYLLIAGSRHTLVGQYHANDQGFVQLRYSH